MWVPDGYRLVPFHADIHEGASTAAGTFTVYDPGKSEVVVTRVTVSSDTAQRVVVGTADSDNERMLAGYIPASNSGITELMRVYTTQTAMVYKPIVAITESASALDCQVDGYVIVAE